MSENNSEICLSEFNSTILRNKISAIIGKSIRSTENISSFTRAQFNQSWAIREAINHKDLHVKAVLPALRKATRFKQWLGGLPDDHDLMYEYQEKVEERTVLDRIGFKQISFYFFQVLQTIISAATTPEKSIPINIGLSAFEANLLDRMTKSWKPNQFVRGDYRKLLKK